MDKCFKLVGSGAIYDYLINNVELIKKDDLLIIASNDIDEINAFLTTYDYKYCLIYSELILSDVSKLSRKDILLAYINGELNNNPLIIYGGNKDTYEYINKLSKNGLYKENMYEATILNNSLCGIHYTYLLAYYDGIVLSKKYDFDLKMYLDNMFASTPELCQGAYRNIWSGLGDDNSYEDVDDVIHGMEMLVCLMKKTKGKELIYDNDTRKAYLNKLLTKYWHDVSLGE